MEKEQVKQISLSDGNCYTGWGYNNPQGFIPHGCGKKYFKDYYAYGNFQNGVLEGPAIVSHDFYMNTAQFKNNRGNGWGLCINRGELAEFGYYKDSQLIVDLTEYALWYFNKMKAAGRNDDMLSVYTFNASHDVAEILIGYRGASVQNSIGLCYMGFHFMSDGSVWMGNTSTRRFTGSLIHFRNDGCIDCGNFENGELIETLDIQNIIDNYYGTYSFENGDLFESLMFDMKPNHEREVFRNIPSIIKEYNYFNGIPATTSYDIGNCKENKCQMAYYVSEVDFKANGNFKSFEEEIWTINSKSIVSKHGILTISDVIYVDKGSMVGIQLSVSGKLKLNSFTCSTGNEDDANIGTIALMRQPHNVWLWCYAFDIYGSPLVSFCGHDNLDEFANFIQQLKRIFK